jgi:hypothetical protein
MEASGDKALEGGGDGAAGVSAAVWDNSLGVEHEANRKPSAKAGRRRMDLWCRGRGVFMVRMIFIHGGNDQTPNV